MSEKKTNLVPAVCTQCGAKLEVDPDQEAAVCPYCGTPFITEKAINHYNITHVHQNNTVHIQQGRKGIFQSMADLADRQLEREQNAKIREQELQLEKQKLEMIREEKRKAAASSFLKKIPWFFGWIYIFPLPLTILLSRKQDIDPRKKKIYIGGAWAAYAVLILLLIITGRASEKKETAAQTPVIEQKEQQTEQETVTWQEKTKQANDFDTMEHVTVTIGDYQIDVPAWPQDSDGNYLMKDSAGKLVAVFRVLHNNTAYTDETLVQRRSADLRDMMKADIFQNSELISEDSVKINGIVMNDGVFHSEFVTTSNNVPVINRMIWFSNPSDSSVNIIHFMETDSSPAGHTDDLMKIINSIRIAEIPQESAETSGNGMTFEEFKKYMDDYESFFVSYAEFMKTYDANDTSMLSQYIEVLSQYNDAMAALDAIDESQLTPEQDAYYTEVMLRISQKLLEAANQ